MKTRNSPTQNITRNPQPATRNNQSGQILLVIIMLLATATTIVLSTAFTSTTNTQTTKLEEESQKALAAAEAGIEAALKQGSVANIGSLQGLGAFTGSASVDTTYNKTTFVTPLIQQDEQYTFYLSDYPGFANPYTSGNIAIYYGSSTDCSQIALEITVIYGISPNYSISRFVSDTSTQKLNSGSANIYSGPASPNPFSPAVFNCKTTSAWSNLTTGIPQAKILFIRPLFASTKIGVEGINLNGTGAFLKPQGKTVTSTAASSSGPQKQVQLFQSYPQIPSDFWVTSF